MIILDWETTGLINNCVVPPAKQPRGTQLCCRKLDDKTLEETALFHSFFDPSPTPVSEDAARVSGLTTERLKGEPKFADKYNDLVEFFLGERTMVAHNLAFDRDILLYELKMIGKETQFPWPHEHICTVELMVPTHGYRPKLGDLFEELFGERFEDAHDARADTEALAKIYRELANRGMPR